MEKINDKRLLYSNGERRVFFLKERFILKKRGF